MGKHQLENKLVIVIGGAGLLGSSFCHCIVENGGTVIIADFNLDAANVLMKKIEKKGGIGEALFVDITSDKSVDDLIQIILKKYRKVDAVVNASYPRNSNYGKKLEEVSYENFCENMNLHLGGYFLIMKRFTELFCEQQFGNIINLASVYGVITPKFDIYEGTDLTMPVEYAAIKSSIIHLSRYFAKYNKGKGIRVNCISPGGIFDNQDYSFIEGYKRYCSNKGILDKQDVSGALIFLLSDSSSFVNGQNIVVDDGFSL